MKDNKKRLLKLFSLAVFTFCVLSCDEEQFVKDTFDEKTFYRERKAWEALGIKDYSVKVKWEWNSFSPRSISYRIIVKDSAFIEPVELIDGKESDLKLVVENTISGIYNWLKISYEARKNSHGSIKIIYDSDLHYPELIKIYFPRIQHPRDGGLRTIYLSEFTPLTSEEN